MIQRPTKYLIRMGAFLLGVALVILWQSATVIDTFLYSPTLIGVILVALGAGVVFVFQMVLRLQREVQWVRAYQAGTVDPAATAPRLLGPLAQMLADRGGRPGEVVPPRLVITAQSLRTVLDGIATRLDENRETARYLTGLLIFLGLLGTFWGLIQTIAGVVDVINSLDVSASDLSALWNELKIRLQEPLSGMGTAFATSLFGLAGSLILGFLDLQAGQAQSRFFLDVEDWLSGLTRLGEVVGGEAGLIDGGLAAGPLALPIGDPRELVVLSQQTAENIEHLRRTIATAEAQRRQTMEIMRTLTEQVASLSSQIRSEQKLLLRIVEERQVLGPAITRLNELLAAGKLHEDQPALLHLRNMEALVRILVETQAENRDRMLAELSSEIRMVSKTMRSLVDPADFAPHAGGPGAAAPPAPGPGAAAGGIPPVGAGPAAQQAAAAARKASTR